ncbi:class III poly(R)-hydroxyalkanoic acid synthase subunit PhaE [Aerolutibacter ruishenii]|uniref:Poly(3-hydroxyalkanoate) polymerase subunit PhaE n=1 Tax=Aerolutibacter ruishenii TaxID=686800 RepID=A0A562LY81_9GAMM|nr:class III poly(R)-hydroxyalkanoic acid synthase subunit PhaE [Lysobacter ruishenii]TWI12607.1 class III poly(R)-hydroxyalkanoic acid synthase PhaE subunit [Lysobacter ruishenii]
MAKQGFGTMGGFGSDEFDAIAKQYWSAWGDMMRGAGAKPANAVPGWDEAVRWWSQLAQGGPAQANDAVGRFNAQAQGWFGQMQQLAAQFAGQNADAGEIARAWKQMLGGNGSNPFADVFKHVRGPGQHDFEAWIEQVRPYLDMLQRDRGRWMDAPTFGFAREHQERWQDAAKAQDEYQAASQVFNTLLAESSQSAFDRFEQLLAERSEPGRQLTSARALFDLWIDAAEDAYAELALSQRFRDAYGHLANAQMRVRSHVQDEIERASALLGVPGRTEVDAAHRKIVQLEREVRRLRDLVQAMSATPIARPTPVQGSAFSDAIGTLRRRAAAQVEPRAANRATESASATRKRPAAATKASKSRVVAAGAGTTKTRRAGATKSVTPAKTAKPAKAAATTGRSRAVAARSAKSAKATRAAKASAGKPTVSRAVATKSLSKATKGAR